jgi:integrase
MNEYLVYKRASNKPRTLKSREQWIRSSLAPILDRPPKGLDPALIATTLQQWADKKKPSTARCVIQECKALWTWMAEEDYIITQPWEHKLLRRLPKRYPKKGIVLPQHKGDDTKKLYEFLLPRAKAEPRGRATVALLGLTMGFRVGEVLSMVAGVVDGGGHWLWVEDAKTEAGQRPVEVPSPLVEIIRAAAQGLAADDRIWAFRYGQIYHSVKKFCRQAGVRRETGMQALRRTNTTLRVLGGQNPDTIIKAIGHTQFSMTRGHYIEPGTLERIGQDRVNRLLSNNNELDSQNSPTT